MKLNSTRSIVLARALTHVAALRDAWELDRYRIRTEQRLARFRGPAIIHTASRMDPQDALDLR